MKGYKLTDKNDRTYGGCRWGENVTHTTDGQGELCGPGWIHFYDDPLLAVVFNPIHADFNTPHLWEVKTDRTIKRDKGTKFGSTKVTTIRKIPLPSISIPALIRFAIYCGQKCCKEKDWNRWADSWLNGSDRDLKSAYAAYVRTVHLARYIALAAAYTTRNAAANAAANAAHSIKGDKPINMKLLIRKAIRDEAKIR